MGLDLLLLPTLGGYWLRKHLHLTRFQAVRESGYHILFDSVIAGVFLLGLANLAILGLNQLSPKVAIFWETNVPSPLTEEGALSLIFGFLLPVMGNLTYTSSRAARRAAATSGDFIELILADSVENQKPVEISLKSRKSYIGLALDSGLLIQGESDISLVPILSGYRHSDTQELKITTNYATAILQSFEAKSETSYEDLQIVIPFSEIASIRLFVLEIFNLLQEEVSAKDQDK